MSYHGIRQYHLSVTQTQLEYKGTSYLREVTLKPMQ